MKYYEAVPNAGVPEFMFADKENLKGFDPERLLTGKRIPWHRWPEGVSFRPHHPNVDGDPSDVVQTMISVPLFSNRLCQTLLEEGIEGIQFLKVNLFHHGSRRPIRTFFLPNIVNVVQALDLARSKYDTLDAAYPGRAGEILMVHKMVLRAEAVDGHDIFRLAPNSCAIIISERVRRLFRVGEFTGFAFYRVKVV